MWSWSKVKFYIQWEPKIWTNKGKEYSTIQCSEFWNPGECVMNDTYYIHTFPLDLNVYKFSYFNRTFPRGGGGGQPSAPSLDVSKQCLHDYIFMSHANSCYLRSMKLVKCSELLPYWQNQNQNISTLFNVITPSVNTMPSNSISDWFISCNVNLLSQLWYGFENVTLQTCPWDFFFLTPSLIGSTNDRIFLLTNQQVVLMGLTWM